MDTGQLPGNVATGDKQKQASSQGRDHDMSTAYDLLDQVVESVDDHKSYRGQPVSGTRANKVSSHDRRSNQKDGDAGGRHHGLGDWNRAERDENRIAKDSQVHDAVFLTRPAKEGMN